MKLQTSKIQWHRVKALIPKNEEEENSKEGLDQSRTKTQQGETAPCPASGTTDIMMKAPMSLGTTAPRPCHPHPKWPLS